LSAAETPAWGGVSGLSLSFATVTSFFNLDQGLTLPDSR